MHALLALQAQVMSEEAALALLGSERRAKAAQPVMFFGTHEFAWIAPPDLAAWGEGCRAKLFKKARSRKHFLPGVQEVRRGHPLSFCAPCSCTLPPWRLPAMLHQHAQELCHGALIVTYLSWIGFHDWTNVCWTMSSVPTFEIEGCIRVAAVLSAQGRCAQAYDFLHKGRIPHDWWYRPASAAKKKPAKRSRAPPGGAADADMQDAAASDGAAGYALPCPQASLTRQHAYLPSLPLLVHSPCSAACGAWCVPDLAQCAQGRGGRRLGAADAACGAARRWRGRGGAGRAAGAAGGGA